MDELKVMFWMGLILLGAVSIAAILGLGIILAWQASPLIVCALAGIILIGAWRRK